MEDTAAKQAGRFRTRQLPVQQRLGFVDPQTASPAVSKAFAKRPVINVFARWRMRNRSIRPLSNFCRYFSGLWKSIPHWNG